MIKLKEAYEADLVTYDRRGKRKISFSEYIERLLFAYIYDNEKRIRDLIRVGKELEEGGIDNGIDGW